MYAPTRIWRKWHRKVNIKQKRYAVCSAIAASALPALVQARGHRISQVPELPLVVDTNSVEPLHKTKNAVALLTAVGGIEDVRRCETTSKKTSGKARLQNRSRQVRVGPLVIIGQKLPTVRAFRNLRGVHVVQVNSLNILDIAPGGHLGRFIVWSRSAFEQLDAQYGTFTKPAEARKGYMIPKPLLTNPDVGRVIYSEEIRAIARPKQLKQRKKTPKLNWLKPKNRRRINPNYRNEKKEIRRLHTSRKTQSEKLKKSIEAYNKKVAEGKAKPLAVSKKPKVTKKKVQPRNQPSRFQAFRKVTKI